MDVGQGPNRAQAELWNGTAGRAWVEAQAALRAMFRPIEELLVASVAGGPRGRVLDVGCGFGSTTMAIARLPGVQRCVGVDLSEPMLAVGRAEAEREGLPATFLRADAQTHAFEPASFDALVSQFGVMFFDDPVRAFANLRGAARSGALLRFVAWRSAGENPFMTTAERAAAPLLPGLPPHRPDGPGQFAFADASLVARVLEASGWTAAAVRPIDVSTRFPEPELRRYLGWMGPVGRLLQTADEATRGRVLDAVRAAFEPFVHGSEVRFVAACWLVEARAPGAP